MPDGTERGDSSSGRGIIAVYQPNMRRGLPPPLRVHGPCRIGRSEATDYVLAGEGVADVHVELRPDSGGVTVTDLGSATGTYVNGTRASVSGTRALYGSSIRVGDTLLCVVRDVTLFEQAPITATRALVGGPLVASLLEQLATLTPGMEPVLLQGEPGLDKPRLARILHDDANRPGNFVEVDCGSLAAEQVEGALFGAEASAIHLAEGGTLMLEHVDALPLNVQDRLASSLADGNAAGDVRIVATSSANVDARAGTGRFSGELLGVFASKRVWVPPLRERHEDVPMLTMSCLPGDAPPLTMEAMELLLGWHWPGNLRELRNMVSAAVARGAMDHADRILPEHLPAAVRALAPGLGSTANAPRTTGDSELRARLTWALREREGNVEEVAKALGYGVTWLYSTLRRLGLDPDSFRSRG